MNARMSEFNAALAFCGLALVDAKVQRRNAIARMYTNELCSLAGVGFQKIDAEDTCTYKDYSIHVAPDVLGITRDELASALLADNIETKKYFYPPLHQQTLYTEFHDCGRDDLSQTEFLADGILSLPIYESLPDEIIIGVADALKRIVNSRPSRENSGANGSARRAAAGK
jgi:dTDP-4-amino-4,6-dideoxygalactose transaminase